MRVVFSLKATKSVQAPWLLTVPLLDGLEAIGVIDVSINWPTRLTSVPLVSDLIGPIPGSLFYACVTRSDDSVEKHEMVVGTERIGRVSRIVSVNSGGGVTLVKNAASCGEFGITGNASLESLEDLALGCHIVHLQARRRGDSDIAVRADEIVQAGLLNLRDLRVRNIAGFLIDSADRVQRSQMLISCLRSSTVGKSPGDDGFLVGYGSVHKEIPEVDSHVNGSSAVTV